MKIVGKCKCGCVLAVMSEAEERMLTAFASEIVGAPMAAPAPVEAPVADVKKPGRKTTATAKAQKVKGKQHACAVCGKPFVRKTSEQTCSPACWKIRNQSQKAAWKPKAAVPPASPSPATSSDHKCGDCGKPLDNPKKKVCDPCAKNRIRAAFGNP